jgi:hypothetical protein
VAWAEVKWKEETSKGGNKEDAAASAEVGEKDETKGDSKKEEASALAPAEVEEKDKIKSNTTISQSAEASARVEDVEDAPAMSNVTKPS